MIQWTKPQESIGQPQGSNYHRADSEEKKKVAKSPKRHLDQVSTLARAITDLHQEQEQKAPTVP